MSKSGSFLGLSLAFGSGVLFALGLWLGGMTDPAKVQGFLDLTGAWDPALAFVLGSAVLVSATSYALVRRQGQPWLNTEFEIPSSTIIDKRLILGAILFGAGWGLGGYCPAPALVSLSQGSMDALIFFVSMLSGTFAYSRFGEKK